MGIFAIAAVIFAVELVIKGTVEKRIKEGEVKPFLGKMCWLRNYHNSGAMLELGKKRKGIVAFLSVAFTFLLFILALLSVYLGAGTGKAKTALALVLGGAFSNTYDRLKRKYVVDYLSLRVKNKRLRSIVFNLADLCIFTGCAMLAITELLSEA